MCLLSKWEFFLTTNSKRQQEYLCLNATAKSSRILALIYDNHGACVQSLIVVYSEIGDLFTWREYISVHFPSPRACIMDKRQLGAALTILRMLFLDRNGLYLYGDWHDITPKVNWFMRVCVRVFMRDATSRIFASTHVTEREREREREREKDRQTHTQRERERERENHTFLKKIVYYHNRVKC